MMVISNIIRKVFATASLHTRSGLSFLRKILVSRRLVMLFELVGSLVGTEIGSSDRHGGSAVVLDINQILGSE